MNTKIAIAVFALYGASLLVAQAGGILVFGERLSWHRIGVLLLCFAGLICFVAPAWGQDTIGWGFCWVQRRDYAMAARISFANT
ncbi:MAG: hypothetical protein R3F37_05970 [Candidatus Competibacteraceae bacterium]